MSKRYQSWAELASAIIAASGVALGVGIAFIGYFSIGFRAMAILPAAVFMAWLSKLGFRRYATLRREIPRDDEMRRLESPERRRERRVSVAVQFVRVMGTMAAFGVMWLCGVRLSSGDLVHSMAWVFLPSMVIGVAASEALRYALTGQAFVVRTPGGRWRLIP